MGWLYHQKLATTLLMETTIQPFWMYFEMKNYHQSWCFQYIYLYKLRKLSFFTKFPEKTIFLTKKKTRRRTLIPALPHHQLVASMNWNITTGTNACQTHTHTKNFHILHMPTLAPSYSLLLQEHEHSGCVFGLSEVLASLPDHEPYLCYCCSQTV